VKSQAFRYNSRVDLLRQLDSFRSEHPKARLDRTHLQQAVAFALRMDNNSTLAAVSATCQIDYSEPDE
jgi:hypothetical protein